jgi:hypothetical protein
MSDSTWWLSPPIRTTWKSRWAGRQLSDKGPHEIERLFFARCRMEPARLIERYAAEDQYYGSLLGVRYAEPFQPRGPLLIADPTVFIKVPFG